MTKKEIKEEETMSKKHSKAVHVAKHTTPPLRPVPIVIKAGAIPPPEDEVHFHSSALSFFACVRVWQPASLTFR
jgi:hypothetical protein